MILIIVGIPRLIPTPHPPPGSLPPATTGTMTGSSFIPLDSGHDAETASLEGIKILGPKWAKLPALTLGFIGLQALWSVEMSYGAPTSELQCHTGCSLKPNQPHRTCYPWDYRNLTWLLFLSQRRYPASSFNLSSVLSATSSFDHLDAHAI